MTNIFKKKIVTYQVLSELMEKLQYMQSDSVSTIEYYKKELEEITDENSWRIDNAKNNISENEERIESIQAIIKYIEAYK